jgi:hypothetical protein
MTKGGGEQSFRLSGMAALLGQLPAETLRRSETEAQLQFHAALELWAGLVAAEIEKRRKREKW